VDAACLVGEALADVFGVGDDVAHDLEPALLRRGALGKRTTTRSAHSGHSIRPRPFWSRKSSSLANQPSKRWPL
jgi:hypothetical protein